MQGKANYRAPLLNQLFFQLVINAVNSTTKLLLRQATIQALQENQDSAARELLDLLRSKTELEPRQMPLLQAAEDDRVKSVNDMDYYAWAEVVKGRFLPALQENGREKFTASELYDWCMASCRQLVPYEIDKWKNKVSRSLKHLKDQGVLIAENKGRVYAINQLPT